MYGPAVRRRRIGTWAWKTFRDLMSCPVHHLADERSPPPQLIPRMRIARHLDAQRVDGGVSAAQQLRRSAPPNAKFTACSGQRTIPTRLPSGANTQMPAGTVQYTRPMLST